MNPYKIMQKLDAEAGMKIRTMEELDIDIPSSGRISLLGGYDKLKDGLARNDVQMILEARRMWGLYPFGG